MIKILIDELLLHPTQILQAQFSSEALEKFNKDLNKPCSCPLNIRLIMINVDMPILDGYEFLEHVQSLSNGDMRFGKDTKIYGLANNIEKIKKKQENNKDRSCDFEDVIQKPVGLKKL